ncbi:uncharacterized protein [Aegilops tauschii subsp. strangulata]|uniref:uncharacterized protein n=1 Tax=Aegilops tauschii subsp. strangulata TaxID=200361 RepID=UPI000989D2BC|nr:uncharacterized protein LOC109772371 [Aegilops tauschii subsp. strangulata]
MSSNGGPTVAVKLFIDKEKKRVLFAESDKDFVDILFSFLTLPLGTVVRLFDKHSQIGFLDELYRSVESLGEEHFQTRDCRTMLLRPVNAAAAHCDRLKVKVDAAQTGIYVCPYYSSSSCGTGRWPQSSSPAATEASTVDGIFSKGGSKFIVTDDLQVAPSSTTLMFSLIDKLGLQEPLNIKEEVLQLNSNKIISLLRRALLSKQPLTGLYFDVAIAPNWQDLVDLLFGLLCIPVGSVIKTYGQLSPDVCLRNIYNSVNVAGCVKQECKSLLLSPKLPPFFGCSSNVLQVEELYPRSHHSPPIYLSELNPKSPYRGRDTGYTSYVNVGPINFMVTDDLRIVDFSLARSLQAIRSAKIPNGELVEKELTLDKTQAVKTQNSKRTSSEAAKSCNGYPQCAQQRALASTKVCCDNLNSNHPIVRPPAEEEFATPEAHPARRLAANYVSNEWNHAFYAVYQVI